MNLFNNLKNFLNLSVLSFFLSFVLLNTFSQFFSLDVSLKLVLFFLFLFNFFRLKNIYLIQNTLKFFVFFFLLITISRFIEYKIFNYIYEILFEKNISWLLTISISFIFKFLYLEILNYFEIFKK
jgi:hypothetical protein